jgi:hypothetical protein
MTHPVIIRRRAESVGDLAQTFQHIDASRLEYLAAALDDCDRPHMAALARSWASEHRMLADRLSGAVAIGAGEDDPEATASAIAFGGPLPKGVAA